MTWIGRSALLLLVATAGCAGVDIYTDKELTNKTGLPFYVAKPYLLVRRAGTDASVDVDVIYVPDVAHPYYAAQRVGIGKAKLTVKMEKGALTEFTADADSGAAAFTGEVAGGLESVAEALRIQREAEILRERARVDRERQEAAARLEGIADRVPQAEAVEEAAARRVSDGLRGEARKLKDESLRGNEGQVAAALEQQRRELARMGVPGELLAELDHVVGRLRSATVGAVGGATFELFEFRVEDGRTTLVPVAVPESD